MTFSHLLPTNWKTLVKSWLDEDTPSFDYGGFVVGDGPQTAHLYAKSPGVLAGVPFFDEVFKQVDCKVEWFAKEGTFIDAAGGNGKVRVATVTGPSKNILLGERPALNMLARASGIASRARSLVLVKEKLKWKGVVAATRKTTPGFRIVEKYAALVGGADTHRHDLSSMIMLKDNHIWSRGSITNAVKEARSVGGFSLKIEVECGSEAEADEAILAGADVIMLDNFDGPGIHGCAASLKEKYKGKNSFLIEGSGGLTLENCTAYMSPHVDILSFGSITQKGLTFRKSPHELLPKEIRELQMDAIVIKEYLTDISQLSVSKNVAIPSLKNDQVLIRVHSVALNFFDILQSQNKYQTQPNLPFILGFEFAGTVVKSSLESGLQIGDRVFGGHQGSFAEFIAVPMSQLLPIPDELSFEEASTLFITAPTSYLAIVERGRLRKGEICLVHAGAGGVGLMAIQIAKARGGIVIATASTLDKLEICKTYGADFVVNYKESNWIDQVKKITKGKGCDVIFDPVGLIDPSLKVIAFNGRILVIGFAAGKIEEIKANKILLKSASIVGVFWGGATIKDPQVVPRVWFSLMEMLRAKEIIPVVNGRVYDGLGHVKEGLVALGSRETYGKVVVRVIRGSGNGPKL